MAILKNLFTNGTHPRKFCIYLENFSNVQLYVYMNTYCAHNIASIYNKLITVACIIFVTYMYLHYTYIRRYMYVHDNYIQLYA